MTGLSWAEARESARVATPRGEILSASLASALEATASEDVLALGPVPHAATSAMDGWAVAGDGPWTLTSGEDPLVAGQARTIVTGGVPPEGTDAVLPSELGELRDGRLRGDTPPPGRHIRPAGEEAHEGDVIIRQGQVLTAARLAILATTGHDQVSVRHSPLVHLLVTGDELVSSGTPEPGRVRDVMTPMLPPLLRGLGARVARVRRVADDSAAVAEAARATDSDLIVSVGGTGGSAADPIEGAWKELGADIRFRGVDMRPGHPASLAVLPDGRPWLALPGNPLAAALTAVSFVPPLVAGHTGGSLAAPLTVVAAAPFTSRAGTSLVPARHTPDGVVSAGASRPHMLRGLAEADVVAIVPREGVEAGSAIAVLPRVW